jgi:hypothetical protein
MKYLELSEQSLMEINMSPSALRQLAANIDARAGMEFEMIIPNVETDVEPEMEADMDQDQRTRSFRDIREFFHDGDYNGRREVNNLMDEIDGEYSEWKQEQITDSWDSEGLEFLQDYIALNDLFDRDEALDAARDEIMDANPDLSPESEDFQKLLSARLDEMEQAFVQQEFDNQGRIYNDAFEEFSDEKQSEDAEEEFLDERYPYMSDIQSNFDISWPYYYDINADSGGMDGQVVADEFSSFMGKPVNYSSSYHGGRREPGTYVVEPDGSLEGDEPGDGGLEFVSPPMPIDEMLEDLNKVKRWAERSGAYTNDSTGLHINVSVPGFSMEKLDYVKLAILLGDERVLNEFGRLGNTYTKSALQIVKQNIQQRPEDAEALLNKMKEHLSTAAAKVIHSGTTSKYTSINTKTGYIEFRSPGGDWLGANFELIEPTLLRFVVALDAALDETKYKQEYAKKLYKLLAPGSNEPGILELFANYSAGELDKAALIRQVRQKQLARDVGKGKATGKMWWSVSRPGYMASIEVVAKSKEEAIDVAVQPGNYPDWASARNTLQAKPLRPYQEKPNGPTLNNRPSNPDGNYVIVSQQDESVPVYRFMASGDQDAISVLRQWIAANPGLYRWTFKKDAEQALGQPSAATGSTTSSTQGNWGIWMAYNNRFVRQPGQIDYNVIRRFPSQAAAMAFLERTREENPQMRTDVEVREIPADYTPGSIPVAAAQPANRNTLTPTGPGPWEVFRRSDNSSVAELGQTNRMSAEVEARRVIDQRREAPELYGVRTVTTNNTDNWSADFERRMQAGTTQRSEYELFLKSNGRVVTAPGGNPIIFSATSPTDAANKIARYVADFNLPGDPSNYDVRSVQQSTQQSGTAPRTLTRPGQGQQAFTGEWKIVDANDREIHRFGGVGNVQADANRVAINWLRQNPRHMQSGVQVLPVMG